MTTRAQMSESAKHDASHTELMRAALEGQTERLKILLKSGAVDINERDNEGRTALMFAVTNMHKESVNVLLESGADVNLKANDGSTALMLAASSGVSEIVRALLSKGADVTAKFTGTGKTALDLAKEKGYTEIVQLLQAAGAR
jgi:ankyrin repeat protein